MIVRKTKEGILAERSASERLRVLIKYEKVITKVYEWFLDGDDSYIILAENSLDAEILQSIFREGGFATYLVEGDEGVNINIKL